MSMIMSKLRSHKYFKILTIVCACFCFLAAASFARADTTSTNLNVTISVPGTGGGGGGGGGGGDERGGDDPPPPPPPPPPPAVTISNVAVSPAGVSAEASWRASASDNVAISRCDAGIGVSVGNYAATVSSTALGGGNFQTTFAGLASDTQYFYRIRCTDASSRTGTYENSFRTLAGRDDIAPIIINVSTVPDVSGAVTTWMATDDVGVVSCSYDYNVNDPGGPYPNRGLVSALANNQYRASLSGLPSNTQYFFRIICLDAAPNGVIAFGQFRTLASQTPPPDAQNFRATPGNQEILLTWEFPQTFSDFSSFVIRRSAGSRPMTIQDGSLVAAITDASARQYRDAGLANGTEYFYTIFVVNTSGLNSNGVSASAIPGAAQLDRDGDSVEDRNDRCDANTPEQPDTPRGTVVAANGCPRVTIVMSGLSIRPRWFQHASVGREPAVPNIMTDSAVITAGLQAGSWSAEDPAGDIQFSVSPGGVIAWGASLNNTFSASYGVEGARLVMSGYQYTIDSRDIDPRSLYRIWSAGGATDALPELSQARLYPREYSSMESAVAPFRVTLGGNVAWAAPYNEIYEYSAQNRTLRVRGVPICTSQNTLQGAYSLSTLHGGTQFVSGDFTYRILPSSVSAAQPFSALNPYLTAQARLNEQRNVNLFMGPKRLQDPMDEESGNSVGIALNSQSVRVALDPCATPSSTVCGNGILEIGEQCDNGARNGQEGEVCTRFCTLRGASVCGNGTVETGEECDDGNANDRDGCSALCRREAPICGNAFTETGEECDDGNVRDRDGCSALCRREAPIETACSDRRDNDNDSLIDLQDPGCENAADTDEYNAPRVAQRDPAELRFWIAERTIQTEPIDGAVASLPSDQLTVGLLAARLTQGADRAELVFRDTRYTLARTPGEDIYTVDMVVPLEGRYNGVVEEKSGMSDVLAITSFAVQSLPRGVVRSASTGDPLSGATVALYDASGAFWSAQPYRQGNPAMIDTSGSYGFLVPAGRYRLRVERPGYHNYFGLPFDARNRVVNQSLTLVAAGPPIKDILKKALDQPSLEIALDAVRALGGKTVEYAAIIRLLRKDPGVQELNIRVIAPSVLGASLALLLPSLWSTLLSFLRYLFLQPLLFLGKRRRRGWGQVYNSLSKLPVDLAIVRLISKSDGRMVQTRVSDPNGRYIFFVEQGDYRLEVNKDGFVFPSTALAGVKSDGRMVDIYHGETIHTSEGKATITPNIPLDPIGAFKTPSRLIVEKYARAVQHTVALAGIATTTVSLFVSPNGVIGAFLAVHIAVYALFVRYLMPRKPKGWGIVYDEKTRKPLGTVIARLFTKEYDRLVESQLTDRKGRYAFLIGPNDYYVTYEKARYEKYRSPDLFMKEQPVEEVFITDDAVLKLATADSPPSPPTAPVSSSMPPPAPVSVPPPLRHPQQARLERFPSLQTPPHR